MPNSHCAEPNEIRHQGHNSNRRKARVPDAVEERDCDFVGDMTAAIFDAVWPVGMSVKGPRPPARRSPWSNANNAGWPERPDRFTAVQVHQTQLSGESQGCHRERGEFVVRPEATWLPSNGLGEGTVACGGIRTYCVPGRLTTKSAPPLPSPAPYQHRQFTARERSMPRLSLWSLRQSSIAPRFDVARERYDGAHRGIQLAHRELPHERLGEVGLRGRCLESDRGRLCEAQMAAETIAPPSSSELGAYSQSPEALGQPPHPSMQ